MPTLADKNAFSFHPNANVTDEMRKWLTELRAIDIIVKQLQMKLRRTGILNRLYILRGRTGSGKSTLMISEIFKRIIVGSRGCLMCSEPRVVLTRGNAEDVLRYHPQWSFGKEMGILNGQEKVRPPRSIREYMSYCTPQVLNDMLTHILQIPDETRVKRELKKIRICVIDEVHKLDLPVMTLLKVIRDVLLRYGNYAECPIFMFASATVDVDQVFKYYCTPPIDPITGKVFRGCEGLSVEAGTRDPLTFGDVKGSSNHPVQVVPLDAHTIKTYNEREKSLGRGGAFVLMAEHFIKYYYKELYNSDAYIRGPPGCPPKIQCRDVLFFVPLVAGIETIANEIYKSLFRNIPTMMIAKGATIDSVLEWRAKNVGKSRVLIVGFSRGYSEASDVILSKPIDPDPDALINETRIVIATSVVETGKTIATLRLCIDMGLDTKSVYNPLTYNVNNPMDALKQIPINIDQMIQRQGRVGREGPGIFCQFYSNDIINKFELTDTAETINAHTLSKLYYDHTRNFKIFDEVDFANENHYMYPTTIDVIITTANDLFLAGFMTGRNEVCAYKSPIRNTTVGDMTVEPWVIYAEYLYYHLKYPLWNAVMTAAINQLSLPSIFHLQYVDVKTLKYQLPKCLEKPDDNIIRGIRDGRRAFTHILFNKRIDRPFSSLVAMKGRIWPTVMDTPKDVPNISKH